MSNEPVLNVERQNVGGSILLVPHGGLTQSTLQPLADALAEVGQVPRAAIILDCARVALMDSKALELLLATHEAVEIRGGSLRLVALNEVCSDIMAATRLLTVLHIHDDIAGAMKAGAGA